jgi:hypothetical protein
VREGRLVRVVGRREVLLGRGRAVAAARTTRTAHTPHSRTARTTQHHTTRSTARHATDGRVLLVFARYGQRIGFASSQRHSQARVRPRILSVHRRHARLRSMQCSMRVAGMCEQVRLQRRVWTHVAGHSVQQAATARLALDFCSHTDTPLARRHAACHRSSKQAASMRVLTCHRVVQRGGVR